MSVFRQLMMRKKGILNCNFVGNPTITDDFILKDCDSSNYLSFSNPIENSNKTIRLKCKFKIKNLDALFNVVAPTTQMEFLKFSYNNDQAGKYGLSFLYPYNKNSWNNVSNNYNNVISNVYTTADVWWWIDIVAEPTSCVVKKSLDGVNYDTIKSGGSFRGGIYIDDNVTVRLGYQSILNSAEIDLKEFKYYFDNQLVFEAVTFK